MYNVFTWGCTVYIMFVCVGVMNVYCLYEGECTVCIMFVRGGCTVFILFVF